MTRLTEGDQAMSWNDFYRRRDVMDAVLKQARRDPQAPLPFAEINGAKQAFDSEEELLLALHYRWMQALSGHLRAAVAGPEDTADVPGGWERDHVEAVSKAWRAAVREHPTLHAVLDANVERYPALRRAHEGELRMLALTAGLADPGEPRDEVTRIGGTLVALLRSKGAGQGRSSNPLGQWLRRLAPTG